VLDAWHEARVEPRPTPERISDSKFDVGAAQRSDLEFRKEPIAMGQSHEDIEPAFRLRVVSGRPSVAGIVKADDVERRAGAEKDAPGVVAERSRVGKLDVDRNDRALVADADLDGWTKSQLIRDRIALKLPADIELVWLGTHSRLDAERPLCRRWRRQQKERSNNHEHPRNESGIPRRHVHGPKCYTAELGLPGMGMISRDAIADLTVLDRYLTVRQTYIAGRRAYSAP
jgi:hypothetical protein